MDTMHRIAEHWKALLEIGAVEPDDDFFELGGNSLLCVQSARTISQMFSVELTAGDLFDEPELRAVAQRVTDLQASGR